MGGRGVALGLLGLFVAGAAVAFVLPPEPEVTVEAILVADVSRTVDATRRCADLHALAGRVADRGDAGVIHLWRTGSRKGEDPSAGEAVPVGRWTLTRAVRMVDPIGHGASPVPAEVAAACAELVDRDETPLFLALRAAVAALRASPATHREVWVRSDGHDEDDPTFARRLRGRDGGPPRIDNAGVAVTLCGLSARRGATAPPIDAIEAAWTAELTEAPIFLPHCH